MHAHGIQHTTDRTGNSPACPRGRPLQKACVKTLGLAPALLLNWVVFALIAAITIVVEKRRHGRIVVSPVQPVQGSLHGWLWLVAAFAGNVPGTRFRPLFGLEVERVKLAAC